MTDEKITYGGFEIEELGVGHIVLRHEGREIHVQRAVLRTQWNLQVDIYGSLNDGESPDASCYYNGSNDKEAE